jgi:hypothetical protein
MRRKPLKDLVKIISYGREQRRVRYKTIKHQIVFSVLYTCPL